LLLPIFKPLSLRAEGVTCAVGLLPQNDSGKLTALDGVQTATVDFDKKN